MIELKNIKKYYQMGDNVVKALDDVSLTIGDGEFVTIIGPSGSGKSTLMNIIGCLDVPTEGKYYIDGVDVSKYSENQLAFLRNKKMGFIFQGFNLLQNLSAYENVELPMIYQGIKIGERKKRAEQALESVGMKERMKHKPQELSGGQQQRVAIARALATNPMCILADEPTGNLDTATGEEIMKILHELNDRGTTVVIITHNDEIAKEAKRVVHILDGKIYADIAVKSNKSLGEKKTEQDSKESLEKTENLSESKNLEESAENGLQVAQNAENSNKGESETAKKSAKNNTKNSAKKSKKTAKSRQSNKNIGVFEPNTEEEVE